MLAVPRYIGGAGERYVWPAAVDIACVVVVEGDEDGAVFREADCAYGEAGGVEGAEGVGD